MPTWIITIVMGVVHWVFGGRQEAEGEGLGKAEAQRDAALDALGNVQKAADAERKTPVTSHDIENDPNNLG